MKQTRINPITLVTLTLLAAVTAFAPLACTQAAINMKDASYQSEWRDPIDVGFSGAADIAIHRRYDSRSLDNGVFGFGWRSDLERSPSGQSDDLRKDVRLKFDPRRQHLQSITAPSGTRIEYFYDGNDLIRVERNGERLWNYAYDQLHNLTRITYPDGKVETINYDTDNDRVLSFRGRNGCREELSYHLLPDDPLNHYVSQTRSKCGGITDMASFEFRYRLRGDGHRILEQVRISRGVENKVIDYDPWTGREIRNEQASMSNGN